MKWCSAISERDDLRDAVNEAADCVLSELRGSTADLLLIFVSEEHRRDYRELPGLLRGWFDDGLLIGCSAGGVIGGGEELEQQTGLSLTAARLPGVEIVPFAIDNAMLPDFPSEVKRWEKLTSTQATDEPDFLLLADPFTFDAEQCIRGLDAAFPQSNKVGGLASAGREVGQNALFLGDRIYSSGLVGIGLQGDLSLESIVAQGCRPIGEPMFVTNCEHNRLLELDGKSPHTILRELYESLDGRDRELMRHSLFLGVGMRGKKDEYGLGDFLIRNILGLDQETGTLAVGAAVHPRSVVQFHLRDAVTAGEELDGLLARYQKESRESGPAGALLFSCLGRGRSLYGRPNHDSDALRRHLGDIPLGGFFCNGEIGPVQKTTFIHGYTSCFGLFRGRERAS